MCADRFSDIVTLGNTSYRINGPFLWKFSHFLEVEIVVRIRDNRWKLCAVAIVSGCYGNSGEVGVLEHTKHLEFLDTSVRHRLKCVSVMTIFANYIPLISNLLTILKYIQEGDVRINGACNEVQTSSNFVLTASRHAA